MNKFKPSTPALVLPVVLEQSESDVLVPRWEVPVLTRPQPPVQAGILPKTLACVGSVQEQSWGAGRQPLANLLEAAWSCYCPKLPTPSFPWGLLLPQQNLHLSCLIANPQVQLWPMEGHHSLRSCCSTPEVGAARWSRPLGKGSSVCDSKIHQCPFHSW